MSLRILKASTKLNFFVAEPVFDHLEDALHKFNDGPFFLGKLSLVKKCFPNHYRKSQISLLHGSSFINFYHFFPGWYSFYHIGWTRSTHPWRCFKVWHYSRTSEICHLDRGIYNRVAHLIRCCSIMTLMLEDFVQEMNKIDAYTQTKDNRKHVIKYMKSRFMKRASKIIQYQNHVSKL